jgi:hypothetical protein
MPTHLRIKLCGIVCSLLWAIPSAAIVRRHDVADAMFRQDDSRFPFLFALYKTRAGYRDCIATLIQPQWAITAAHCTKDQPFLDALAAPGGRYTVVIGGHDAFIDRVDRHPGSDGQEVDLALLHFAQPIAAVTPVSVYRGRDEVGRVVLLPGWGGAGDGIAGLSKPDGQFRVGENRVDAAANGRLVWVFDDPRSFTNRALPLEAVSGPGDSGGPALIMSPSGWATVGVSRAQRTFGRPEGIYGAEEVYVRLSDYLDWIDATATPASAR